MVTAILIEPRLIEIRLLIQDRKALLKAFRSCNHTPTSRRILEGLDSGTLRIIFRKGMPVLGRATGKTIYHKLGTVVTDSPRFDYLDSAIIDEAKLPRNPRVAGNFLEFLTISARLSASELKVRLHRWNIQTLAYSRANIPMRPSLARS